MRRSRSRRAAPTTRTVCEHLLATVGAEEPEPQTPICQECTDAGKSSWAHLRMCLTCGHVGCCDSSPDQHATAHFQATGHPVMRSIEPGESWRWCYIDTEVDSEMSV